MLTKNFTRSFRTALVLICCLALPICAFAAQTSAELASTEYSPVIDPDGAA